MRTLALAFTVSILTLGLAGCGGSSAPASVSGASPGSAFLGRTLDVTLSGSSTSWDGNATVSFGDGVTVNKVTAASASALIANITVAPTATPGPRDVTVTQGGSDEAFKMAFQIESAVEATVLGTAAQGSVLFLSIVNKDLEHLFDDTSTGGGLFSAPTYTNVSIKGSTGIKVAGISSVTPFKVDATLTIDVDAPVGKFDLDLESGPMGGKRDAFVQPALFDLVARTATPLSGTATASVDKPDASSLYSFSPGGADHLITITATPSDAMASATVIVLDKSGTFANLVTAPGASASWLATNADPVYVLLLGGAGDGGYTVDIAAADQTLATQTGGEGNNTSNNTPAGATALMTPPIQVKGATLSDVNDVDCYSVTLAVGKSIHARTAPGDAMTDTSLQFYGPDGTTALEPMPVDADYHEDATSPAATTAGLHYVCVGTGQTFDASQKAYNLIVTIE